MRTPNYPPSFVSRYGHLSNQLINTVEVEANGEKLNVYALWDTGASSSCISEHVIDKLKLQIVGYINILTPSGKSSMTQHFINVTLPNSVHIDNLNVSQSKIGEQKIPVIENGRTTFEPIGMLIGMNIIGRGDFAVTNYNGKTTFTFRYPSFSEIDFVQMCNNFSPARNVIKTKPNDSCPCGSGRKFKNCCGKI